MMRFYLNNSERWVNAVSRFALFLMFVFFARSAMAIEEPKYKIVHQSGEFELRAYESMIIAETTVSGNLDDASSAGFKLIADYIFGNNISRAGESEEISMTAPVTIEAKQKASSEKIEMTAPVAMEAAGDKWRMHFVMPSQYTMGTLPKPNNDAVTLRQVPAKQYAVIKFSWLAGEKKVAKKTAELMAWVASKNISPVGKPVLARYNPPWTLPFLRRNEVMVEYSLNKDNLLF